MSFIGGLAASPDPSNDVVFNNQHEPDPHDLLLQDAWQDVQQFGQATHSPGDLDDNQTALGSFDYSHRGLFSLPAELVDIIKDHATRLALNHNRLTSLSGIGPRMGEFRQLTYLVLKNCDVHEFPRDVLACTSLETLDLHANQIRDLPEDLSKLRNLKKLALDRNKVIRIPICVAKMASLNYFSLMNNPIEFPEKSAWKLLSAGNRTSDELGSKQDSHKIMEETKRLKRALLHHEKSERSPESEHSESATDIPRPFRKKLGGRFPVRPSLSGLDIEPAASAPPGSPASVRPPLKSSKTTLIPQLPRANGTRPGIEPLVSPDRHRSNSESHMTTSRRQKRMGVHVSRGGNSSGEMSLEGSLDFTHDLSTHARGTSSSSLLLQMMQGGAIGDASGAESPYPSDLSRSASLYEGQGRLSSLPENKRKSHYNHPDIKIAETVLYTIEQVEAPIKKLVNATKPAGRRRALDRSCYGAFANKSDLGNALHSLEIYDEEDGDKRHSVIDLQGRCERAMSSFQQLLEDLQAHTSSVLEYSRTREVRMVMHMTYAGVVEVQDLWSKLTETLETTDQSEALLEDAESQRQQQQHTMRLTSPSPRPTTSLRVKDRNRVVHHHHKSSNMNKPLPSPRSIRSTSGTSLLSRMPSHASTSSSRMPDWGPPTPALTHSNSFMSNPSTEPLDDDEADRAFENIFKSLKTACSSSIKSLDLCRQILSGVSDKQRGSGYGKEDVYYDLMRKCDYAIAACKELKKRIATLQVHQPHVRGELEFWQVATGFTRAFTIFITSIRDATHPIEIPEQMKTLLRPVHRNVKEAGALIEASPWCELAVHGPTSASPSSAINGHLPFSMSSTNPPPVPPPAKDLPTRPSHQLPYGNGLGLQTNWASAASLNSASTFASSTGTIRALPTSHPRENGGSSATPTPASLSRASSRAGYSSSAAPTPSANSSFSSYFSDNTPTDTSMPKSARLASTENRYGPQSYIDTRTDTRYTPSLPELSPVGGGNGARSAYSSGYSTPLPPTPMSAALGPAAQATLSTESNTGTMRKINTSLDNGSHSHQNSYDDVTNGYSGLSTNAQSNTYSNGYSGFYGDLGGGPGTIVPARPINGSKPNLIERSVSAAGYYPSVVPQRMASRNVSRSASQRRNILLHHEDQPWAQQLLALSPEVTSTKLEQILLLEEFDLNKKAPDTSPDVKSNSYRSTFHNIKTISEPQTPQKRSTHARRCVRSIDDSKDTPASRSSPTSSGLKSNSTTTSSSIDSSSDIYVDNLGIAHKEPFHMRTPMSGTKLRPFLLKSTRGAVPNHREDTTETKESKLSLEPPKTKVASKRSLSLPVLTNQGVALVSVSREREEKVRRSCETLSDVKFCVTFCLLFTPDGVMDLAEYNGRQGWHSSLVKYVATRLYIKGHVTLDGQDRNVDGGTVDELLKRLASAVDDSEDGAGGEREG